MRGTVTDWPLVIVGGPWPERIGLRAREVQPKGDYYPWHGRGRGEVVLLVENDPLSEPHDGWTCVMDRRLTKAAS